MDIFSCVDAYGQNKALNIIKDIFSGYTLNIEQHIEDKGRVDILMTATTKNKEYYYAIECKDRYFPHNHYDDMMIEVNKYNTLKDYSSLGYKPIYLNTFSDDTYLIWNLNTCVKKEGYKTAKKTTVVEGEPVNRLRYFLPVSGYTFSGYTK